MKRTTIFIDEAVESDLYAFARRQKRSVAGVVREAVASFLADRRQDPGPALRFLAVGRSGHRDTADRHEEWLWADLAAHQDSTRLREAGDPPSALKKRRPRTPRARQPRRRQKGRRRA